MVSHVAMSTSWNARRHDDARGVVEEILGFGIDHLEVGYLLNQKQLRELAELLPQGRFKVCSVHNFCPIPSGHSRAWGDDFLLSSLNDEERRIGVEATLQTLEWAGKLGAKVVVMHLGRVNMDRTTYSALKQRVAEGHGDSQDIALAVAGVKQERERLAKSHLDAVKRSLNDILASLPPGITLGIECRSDYYEIPTLSELTQLLAEYGIQVGYWHDVGHAFLQESMGFYEKDEYIRTLTNRLIGVHIHDSLRVSDHRAPGCGEIDFESSVKPYLKDGVLKVLELHPRVTREEAAKGIEFLRTRNIIL